MYYSLQTFLKSVFAVIAVIISHNVFSQSQLYLIPEPKQVIMGEGAFMLKGKIIVYLPRNASKETMFSYEQLYNRLGNAVSKNFKKADIVIGLTSDDPKIKKAVDSYALSLPEQGKAEGYILLLTDKKIIVTAETEAGLFYGIQTLKQLINSNEKEYSLPVVTIIDWPSLRYRGWMDDISRGPIPTVEFLKECILKMSSYKQNFFTLYTEDVFKLKNYPDIAPADGLSAKEVKELTEYAAMYHIDLIGNFQSFGHMAKILANPSYSTLGENEDILNPADEDTYTFLKNVYSEIVPSYKSPFFNINCDETFGLGEGKSKALAEKIGIDGIYASHINRIDQLIKPYNKRIMMWGDIAVNNPDIIEKLPRDLIILSWGYHAAESFDNAIIPFKKSGFEFMVAPGVSCWNEVWPGMNNAVINISNYVRDGYKLGSIGMMNTAWDDNGHNLFNSNWHGLIWGAESSWNPLPEAYGDQAITDRNVKLGRFNKSFDKIYFDREKITDVLLAIDSLRNFPVPGILNEWAFWSDISDFSTNNTDENFVELNRSIISKTEMLTENLKSIWRERPRHREMIDNALLALERISFTAKKNITRALLFNIKESGDSELILQAKSEINKLTEQLYKIKKEYVVLWERENRGWWLDKNLNDYNNLLVKLQEAGSKVLIETAPVLSNGKLNISLKSLFGEGTVVYTTDGTEPNINSQVYKDSLQVSSSMLIKARTILNDKPGPVTEKFITYHKGIGCLKELHSSYSTYKSSYSAGGINGLLDGLKGSASFSDGRWQGYQGQDLDIEIDLKAKTPINNVTVDFMQNSYAWILLPREVEIQISEDGKNYKSITTVSHNLSQMSTGSFIHPFVASLQSVETRYLRIKAYNPGPLPIAHHAAGNPSYIFADEIVIN